MQISFAVPGSFILAAFLGLVFFRCRCKQNSGNFLPFTFSKYQSSGRAWWPQRYANNFLVLAMVLRDAAMFPWALQQLMLSSVCAKTCMVAGWDLVWELWVCSIPKPFPSFPSSQKTKKVTAGLVLHLPLFITFTAALSPATVTDVIIQSFQK